MVGFVIVAAVLAFLLLQNQFMTGGGNWPDVFKSNGERIYFTATSDSGQPVTARGHGMGMGGDMMMGGRMACASCHRADRKGGRLMPRFWVFAPPLTAAALFGKEHDEDGHGDHDSYDDASLQRAITQGIDEGGKPLDRAMPRWSMSAKDMGDLIAFLRTP